MGGRQAQTKTPKVVNLPPSDEVIKMMKEKLATGEIRASEVTQTISQLKKAKTEIMDDWLQNSEEAYKIAQQLQARAEAGIAEGVDQKIVEGIKNSDYFKKQGEVLDIQGEGYLMEKGGKYKIATADEAKRMPEWNKGLEIDQLAQQAGYDNGYDYLLDQLDLSGQDVSGTLSRLAENKLIQESPQFENLHNTIQKLEKETKNWKKERPGLQQVADLAKVK